MKKITSFLFVSILFVGVFLFLNEKSAIANVRNVCLDTVNNFLYTPDQKNQSECTSEELSWVSVISIFQLNNSVDFLCFEQRGTQYALKTCSRESIYYQSYNHLNFSSYQNGENIFSYGLTRSSSNDSVAFLIEIDEVDLNTFSSCYSKKNGNLSLSNCINQSDHFNLFSNSILVEHENSCFDRDGNLITCPFNKSLAHGPIVGTANQGYVDEEGNETRLGYNFYAFDNSQGTFSIISLEDQGDNALAFIAISIVNFIDNVIMTVFWIGLSGFLVIKGAFLGTAIVKASDDANLRQEKISSLKYLFVGVFIAAFVGGIAQVVVNVLVNTF